MFINSTNNTTELCLLGAECNTDKSPFALHSVCCAHRKGYTAVYSLLFSPLRYGPVKMAEIGIEAGASLLMWSRWFGPRAEICALERDPHKIENCQKLVGLDQVTFAQTDISAEETVTATFRSLMARSPRLFDLIIDDSSHELEHQNILLRVLPPFMKSGAIFIVEDLQRGCRLDSFQIQPEFWHCPTLLTCHHDNRRCSDNDVLLYVVRR